MPEFEIKDPEVHDRVMELLPVIAERVADEIFKFVGITSSVLVLEIARQHGGPSWITWLEFVVVAAVAGYLQARYNKVRMRESTKPDGRRMLHVKWKPALLGFLIGVTCWLVAYFIAARLPEVLAGYTC